MDARARGLEKREENIARWELEVAARERALAERQATMAGAGAIPSQDDDVQHPNDEVRNVSGHSQVLQLTLSSTSLTQLAW